MHNPDPKRYIIRKLRGGEFILVDRQILRWRSTKKKDYKKETKQLFGAANKRKPKKITDIDFFGE